MKVKETDIWNLQPDRDNPNRHTKRGLKLLQKSLRENGVGRSLVVDKNNKLICGNATYEALKKLNVTKAIVVETEGDEVVCVKRTDLDLDQDARARNLSIADNQTNAIDLAFDPDILDRLAFQFNCDFSNEWEITLPSAPEEDSPEDFPEDSPEDSDQDDLQDFVNAVEINDLTTDDKDNFHQTVECYFAVPKRFYQQFLQKIIKPLFKELAVDIKELKPRHQTYLTAWLLLCYTLYKHILAAKKTAFIRRSFPNTWLPLFLPLDTLDEVLALQRKHPDLWDRANSNLLNFLRNVCQETSTS